MERGEEEKNQSSGKWTGNLLGNRREQVRGYSRKPDEVILREPGCKALPSAGDKEPFPVSQQSGEAVRHLVSEVAAGDLYKRPSEGHSGPAGTFKAEHDHLSLGTQRAVPCTQGSRILPAPWRPSPLSSPPSPATPRQGHSPAVKCPDHLAPPQETCFSLKAEMPTVGSALDWILSTQATSPFHTRVGRVFLLTVLVCGN